MTAKPAIAFLGIGLMGEPQARNLLRAGFPLTAYNRTRAKAEALMADGARVTDTPAEAARDAEIIITMLQDGAVVADVLLDGPDAAVAGARPGTLIVDMSSTRPDEATTLAARLAEHGLPFLDAPVSGGTVGAEEASLAIMCGGAAADYARAVPAFEAMGRPTHVGPSGAGQMAKLANQMIVGVTIGAVAEALAICARFGADPEKVREALRGGFAESRILELHGGRMVTRDFAPRGRTSTQVKDLENAMKTATGLDFTAPLLERTTALFKDLAAHAGDLDHSALLLEIERLNAAKQSERA